MATAFEKESVGSNSSVTHPPITGRFSPPTTHGVRYSPPQGNNNNCFRCNQPGHWIKDCPNKKTTTPNPKKPHPQSSLSENLPIVHCRCGVPSIVRLSLTQKNPNRKFYTCPDGKCKFFKWCDDVKIDEIIDTPICRCRAGSCRIDEKSGRKFFVCPIKKGQGACDFVQPVDAANERMGSAVNERMGSPQSTLTNCHDTSPSSSDTVEEGDFNERMVSAANESSAANKSMSSPLSTLTTCHDTSPSSSDTVEEGVSSHQGMDFDSPVVVDTSALPQTLGTASELSTKDKVTQVDFQGQEGTSDEPLRKNYKRLRHGAPKIDGFVLDFTNDCLDVPQSKSRDPTTGKALRFSALASEDLIQQRQAKFVRQIFFAGDTLPGGFSSRAACSTSSYINSSDVPTTRVPWTHNCLETAATYEILGFHIKGWCGRLVFTPSRCLTFPAPKPFFCCVFPSFDPITIPQDVNISDAEAVAVVVHRPSVAESSNQLLTNPGQPLVAVSEPLGLNPPPKVLLGNIMTQSILEVFEQAAMRLQDGLVGLLESMDFRDHESMVREAYSVFGALEDLHINFQLFKDRVMTFIGCAASLAEVDKLSIQNISCSQELVETYNRQKMQLEDINRLRAETCAALKASNEHHKHLQNEALRIKEMLFRIEVKLSCCEAERLQIGNRLDQINKDVLETELSVQLAFEEAEAAQKLCEQREAERNVAKTCFEEARSKLRRNCNISLL